MRPGAAKGLAQIAWPESQRDCGAAGLGVGHHLQPPLRAAARTRAIAAAMRGRGPRPGHRAKRRAAPCQIYEIGFHAIVNDRVFPVNPAFAAQQGSRYLPHSPQDVIPPGIRAMLPR
jgi:hypothetical protein